jgi:hypothetical protein
MLLMTVSLMIAPELSSTIMQQAYESKGNNFGFLYVFLAATILPLLLWFAFGKYGGIKLGDPDDEPILGGAAIMHERNKYSDELYAPNRMSPIICLMELV